MNFGKRYAKERLVSAYIYSDYYLTFFEELHTFKCNRGHESAGRAALLLAGQRSGDLPLPHGHTGHWTLKLSTNLREFLQCPEKALTRASSLFNAPARAFTIENIMMLLCKMGDSSL